MGKEKQKNKVSRKKEIRTLVKSKLEVSFAEFKDALGEEKFNTIIKKESKILSHSLYVKKKKEKSLEIQEISV